MTFPFPPLWMRAEDGSLVDVSGAYWFVIAMVVLVFLPPAIVMIRGAS